MCKHCFISEGGTLVHLTQTFGLDLYKCIENSKVDHIKAKRTEVPRDRND